MQGMGISTTAGGARAVRDGGGGRDRAGKRVPALVVWSLAQMSWRLRGRRGRRRDEPVEVEIRERERGRRRRDEPVEVEIRERERGRRRRRRRGGEMVGASIIGSVCVCEGLMEELVVEEAGDAGKVEICDKRLERWYPRAAWGISLYLYGLLRLHGERMGPRSVKQREAVLQQERAQRPGKLSHGLFFDTEEGPLPMNRGPRFLT